MALWRVERCCDHSFIANALAPGAAVIDLGVNAGSFATWMADRFACVVYGAEPDPDLYKGLLQHGNIRVIPCAIGGRKELATLKRARGECPTLFGGAFQPDNQVEVNVLTLGEFLSRSGLAERERIELVKVDIEGAELAMFEETPDALLRRVVQFTVEFHDFIWPELCQRVNDVRLRLRSLGFQEISFSLDNSDVLFLNRDLLDVGPAVNAYLIAAKYARGIHRRTKRLLRMSSASS